jgi:beta-glucosidase
MNCKRKLLLALSVLCGVVALAQEPYQNANLPAAERAKDLLSRLTLEEKISQTLNASRAIPRLGIPATDWWNEALHGVARAGKATVFPQTIGLAATFDTEGVLNTYTMVSDEARAKHHYYKNQNQYKRYQGLTFWTPNINIFRDPRWGRGMETYGEDPFLTSRMGVVVVKGLQGDSSRKYDKLHACAKHYAVHSGPEWNRHSFDAKNISPRDLWETYLPAFKCLVTEAGVKEVMCAYNRFEGEPCCSNKELLVKILRKDWGFNDVIVSDCGAIDDFYRNNAHQTHASATEAAADAVISGTDLVCGSTYNSLMEAAKRGIITEAAIDTSVLRLLRARFELGMFDADSLVSWSSIPYSVVESPEHVAHALKMARESIVLLKNKNKLLPLSATARIAVVGPNAGDSVMLWANYNGTPTKTVTILEGICSKLPKANVVYEKGCDYVEETVFVSKINECSYEGNPGFKASFWNTKDFSGPVVATHYVPNALRYDAGGNTAFAQGVNLVNFSARFETVFSPSESGEVILKMKGDEGYRLLLNDSEVLAYQFVKPLKEQQYSLKAQKGKPVKLVLEYYQYDGSASFRFDMGVVQQVDYTQVAAKYKNMDAIVFAGGISAQLEGEEMSVLLPGFKKGDRTRLELPDVQQKMLRALKATGKPVILVLCAGSSIALPWENEQLDAILDAWYPGQQGGNAVADVLFGDYNPAGRLPLTFYEKTEDLPDFEDYNMTKGRTYRYFKGKPVYPFGYGLSYTSFSYEKAMPAQQTITVKDSASLTIWVKNTGQKPGDEVVQLYIRNLNDPDGPVKSLRGFKRVHINPGQVLPVVIPLPNSAFEFYHPGTGRMQVRPGKYEILYGGSSDDKDLKKCLLTIQ